MKPPPVHDIRSRLEDISQSLESLEHASAATEEAFSPVLRSEPTVNAAIDKPAPEITCTILSDLDLVLQRIQTVTAVLESMRRRCML
jgi:hypothetical protein